MGCPIRHTTLVPSIDQSHKKEKVRKEKKRQDKARKEKKRKDQGWGTVVDEKNYTRCNNHMQ